MEGRWDNTHQIGRLPVTWEQTACLVQPGVQDAQNVLEFKWTLLGDLSVFPFFCFLIFIILYIVVHNLCAQFHPIQSLLRSLLMWGSTGSCPSQQQPPSLLRVGFILGTTAGGHWDVSTHHNVTLFHALYYRAIKIYITSTCILCQNYFCIKYKLKM